MSKRASDPKLSQKAANRRPYGTNTPHSPTRGVAQNGVTTELVGVFVPGQPAKPDKNARVVKAKAVMNGVLYDAVMVLQSPPIDFDPETLPYWNSLSANAQRFLKHDIPHCRKNGLCVFCYPTGREMKAQPGRAYCYHHITGAEGFEKRPLALVEVLLHANRQKNSAVLHASQGIATEEGLLLHRRIGEKLRAIDDSLLEIRRFLDRQCIHCGKPLPPRNRGIEGDNLTPGRKPTFFCSPKKPTLISGVKRMQKKSKCELQHHRERTGRRKPEAAHPKAVRARERYEEIVEAQWSAALALSGLPKTVR